MSRLNKEIMSSNGPFVSLHNHSEQGSPLDGFSKLDSLFDRAKELGQSAIAITEHGTCASAYDSYKESIRTGVKLIPGIEAYFTPDFKEKKSSHMVLLPRNENGYKNILRLNYEAYKHQSTAFGKMIPRISWNDIESYGSDVFCLTACSNGLLAKDIVSDDFSKAESNILRLQKIFSDRLYLEIQPHALKTDDGKVDQVKLNEKLIEYSSKFGIPFVTTCDAHYVRQSDSKYHDMMLSVRDGKALSDPYRFKYGVQEMYLKDHTEITGFFGSDISTIAMRNSMIISDACEMPHYLKSRGAILPKFPVADQSDYVEFDIWWKKYCDELPEDKAYLRYHCTLGFEEFTDGFSIEKKREYWDRVKYELSVLELHNFSSYMLIVADYVEWANSHQVIAGPGRGSVNGSLVAYLLKITKTDSIKYDLPFERFHNKQKKAFPDIDCDFSHPARVQAYIKEKYGADHVAQISNWACMTPKVVLKDVARSLEIGGDKAMAFKIANHITSIMPDTHTIEEAVEDNKEVADFMVLNPDLLEHSIRLQGLTRQWSVHAAGVVIGDCPLYEIVPLRIGINDDEDYLNDGKAEMVTAVQWEKSRVEEFGLVKMDILGLNTLTIMADALNIIKETTGTLMSIDDIPLDDERTYRMIGRGENLGVFQLEASLSPLCMKIKPMDVETVSAINALGRPSCPAEQRKAYIARRLGIEKVRYTHPSLVKALGPTYGISLYEECMMYIARDCAGWDLNEADGLRKLTKLKGKDPALALKIETNFIKDCMGRNGMTYEQATEIWENEISSFAGYGFSKNHSIPYSMISVQTAWLKCNYPTQFMCALLNGQKSASAKAKIPTYLAECKRLGIAITPPDINKGGADYKVTGPKTIATGFSAVSGIGPATIPDLIKNQPYIDLCDFLLKGNSVTITDDILPDQVFTAPEFIARGIKIDKTNKDTVKIEAEGFIGKSALQSLAACGALDSFGRTRKDIHDNYEEYRTKVKNYIKKAKLPTEADLGQPDDTTEWDRRTILWNEREVMGRPLSGETHEIFRGFFKGDSNTLKFKDIPGLKTKSKIKVEGIVKAKQKEFTIKKEGPRLGKKFAKYLIEDLEGNTTSITLWNEHYEKFKATFVDGIPFKALCEVGEYMDEKSLNLLEMMEIYGIKNLNRPSAAAEKETEVIKTITRKA